MFVTGLKLVVVSDQVLRRSVSHCFTHLHSSPTSQRAVDELSDVHSMHSKHNALQIF